MEERDFDEQADDVEDRPQAAGHDADELVQTANHAGIAISSEIRRKALASLRNLMRDNPNPKTLITRFFRETREILRRYEPVLARTITDSQLAGYLKGGVSVIDALPKRPTEPFARYLVELANEPPRVPPLALYAGADEPRSPVRFPVIEEAARVLQERRVMTAAEFYDAARDAKLRGFTVSRIANLDAIEKIQQHLVEAVADGDALRTFRGKVEDSLDGSGLSPARLEGVFRVGIMSSYSRGLKNVLAQPLVGGDYGAFPFRKRRNVADSRQTPLCRIFSHSGLPLASGTTKRWAVTPEGYEDTPLILRGREFWTGQPIPPKWIPDLSPDERAIFATGGSEYFWAGDPVWQLVAPPSHWNCRCCPAPITLAGAARAGVAIAHRWLATGIRPSEQELCVPIPEAELPPGWVSVWAA
jgi:hypothetical protein